MKLNRSRSHIFRDLNFLFKLFFSNFNYLKNQANKRKCANFVCFILQVKIVENETNIYNKTLHLIKRHEAPVFNKFTLQAGLNQQRYESGMKKIAQTRDKPKVDPVVSFPRDKSWITGYKGCTFYQGRLSIFFLKYKFSPQMLEMFVTQNLCLRVFIDKLGKMHEL